MWNWTIDSPVFSTSLLLLLIFCHLHGCSDPHGNDIWSSVRNTHMLTGAGKTTWNIQVSTNIYILCIICSFTAVFLNSRQKELCSTPHCLYYFYFENMKDVSSFTSFSNHPIPTVRKTLANTWHEVQYSCYRPKCFINPQILASYCWMCSQTVLINILFK